MNAAHQPPIAPPWDREGTLAQATGQVRDQVARRAAHDGQVMWLSVGETPAAQMERIAGLGARPVVGSEFVLWTWPPTALGELSALLLDAEGILVFVEPTAGLGIRRALQLAAGRWFRRSRGHDYRRDLPAELRSVGFIVTTQVRLRHRVVGDYVRGEARHFQPR